MAKQRHAVKQSQVSTTQKILVGAALIMSVGAVALGFSDDQNARVPKNNKFLSADATTAQMNAQKESLSANLTPGTFYKQGETYYYFAKNNKLYRFSSRQAKNSWFVNVLSNKLPKSYPELTSFQTALAQPKLIGAKPGHIVFLKSDLLANENKDDASRIGFLYPKPVAYVWDTDGKLQMIPSSEFPVRNANIDLCNLVYSDSEFCRTLYGDSGKKHYYVSGLPSMTTLGILGLHNSILDFEGVGPATILMPGEFGPKAIEMNWTNTEDGVLLLKQQNTLGEVVQKVHPTNVQNAYPTIDAYIEKLAANPAVK